MDNQKRKLVFKTRYIEQEDGSVFAYCGIKNKPHRWASKRTDKSATPPRDHPGHDPGFVYLLSFPDSNPNFAGKYKIGKTEYILKPQTDDFDLDEIENHLLGSLYKRLKKFQSGGRTDDKYKGAKLVHAIRVACGEGAEKQPQSFFGDEDKKYKFEVYNLDGDDIELFKSATGCVVGHCIKHYSAKRVAQYLREHTKESEERIAAMIQLD